MNGRDPVVALSDTEIAELLEMYPSKNRRQMAASLITDSTFLCSTQFAGHSYPSDFFLYRFNHRDRCASLAYRALVPGVYHGIEMPYVFGNPTCKLTVDEEALTTHIQTYWTNFAKYLDPSPDDHSFPKYDNTTRRTLVFQTPTDAVDEDYRREQCDFFERTAIAKMLASHGGPDVHALSI